ncbi:hypothetical protein [Polaromonas sp. CF318]|uniref:hypothetical protein n=1 Tax=Polaromonas sp. CF318 TaxID=1144318 RepID=UPI00056B6276|nr:hypothetical protein [Polaromonas sp. CF318]
MSIHLTNRIHTFLLLFLVLLTQPAFAENWITYYQIGNDQYAIDADSIRRTDALVKYRSGIVGMVASVVDMQADCTARTRGQMPDPRMNSTYVGTLGGEEVATVCKLADARPEAVAKALSNSPNIGPRKPELLKLEEVRHFCDGVMGSIGAGNLAGTMPQIQSHLSATPKRLKELNDALGSWYIATLVQLGDAQGSEFVKQDGFSNTLLRLTYIAKYERGATRWIFLFYKQSEGWGLIDVGSDANLQAVLEK